MCEQGLFVYQSGCRNVLTYLFLSVCVAVYPVYHILVLGFRQVSWCVYCYLQVWVFQCERREGLGAAVKAA